MSVDNETRDTILAESGEQTPATAKTSPLWRRRPSSRLVLTCLILVAVGYLGGILEAKHTGTTSASAGGGAALGARTGAAPTAAGAAPTTATQSSIVGTVKLVDGSTIYLTESDGSVVKVTTSGATKLSVSATGSAKDLKTGSTIVVTGPTDASGGINATAVTQSQSRPAAPGAATGQGAAGARPTTSASPPTG
ncbi:MAG: hypothetical protein QOJ11_3802 [Frankiales bacterium]|jgi:hypothetical protein|nr:hypothetical protein [Frankiales bacterium]